MAMKFSDIKKLFPEEDWDIGYLTLEQLKTCCYMPVKWKTQKIGWDSINNIHFNWLGLGIANGIVLVRQVEESYDYSLYEESKKILYENGLEEFKEWRFRISGRAQYGQWAHLYTNFKEAQILSGLGVRAKNSLVYNRRFGFDNKICVVVVWDKIIEPPNNKPDFKYWDRCDGCDDCRLNCPVRAIHNEKEPYWLDSSKCDNFIGLGNHPRIPSMKKFWHKNVHPEVPQEDADRMRDFLITGALPWDANGYEIRDDICYKDGKQIPIPLCRECLSQPRCSKWDGNYPYQMI
jgi:Pyruvate/2-oxoacid:ferredoxin oxidoreductase delta subunit